MRKQLLAAVASPAFATLKPEETAMPTDLTPLERELCEMLERLVAAADRIASMPPGHLKKSALAQASAAVLGVALLDELPNIRALLAKAKDRT